MGTKRRNLSDCATGSQSIRLRYGKDGDQSVAQSTCAPLEWVRLRFEAEVTRQGVLPRFWGPALRGALGFALRKMVCITHLPQCAPCLLRFQCPYPRFLEPFPEPDHPFGRRLSSMPCPFALGVPPPADGPCLLEVGEPLVFRLTMWRWSEVLLPYLVVALQRSLERGIGRGLQARLQQVVAEHPQGERVVFWAQEGLLRGDLPRVPWEAVMAPWAEPVKQLRVRFLTPVRLDVGGRLQNPITFVALIKAANERGRALFWAYERREPPWDGKALVRAAEGVEEVEGKQQWLDLSRFSRRQQERLKIGGIVGWATFRGADLSPFVPLLRLMEVVHVGKLSSMGLGRLEVEPLA